MGNTANSDAFEPIFEKQYKDLMDFKNKKHLEGICDSKLEEAIGDKIEETTLVALARENEEQFKRQLDDIFELFDTDHSGALDRAQCRNALAAYACCHKKWAPKLVEAQVDMHLAMMEALILGKKKATANINKLKADKAQMVQHVLDHINAYMQDDANIDKVISKMDLNKNGLVEKTEFNKAFLTGVEEVSLSNSTAKQTKKLLGMK